LTWPFVGGLSEQIDARITKVSFDNRGCCSEVAKYRPMQHPERNALALVASATMLQTRPVRFLIAPVPSCGQEDRAAHISARVDELADPRFQSEVA